MNCLNCDQETTNPKFCCKSCSATYNNKLKSKRKKKVKYCRKCNKETGKDRGLCDECLTLKDYTLEEAIYEQHHKSSAFALVRSRARRTVKHLEQICSHCGYDKHVEVCHVIPIHGFPLTTKISEINSLENLLLLCPNCHWEFDHLN